jgi:hypothetical protein
MRIAGPDNVGSIRSCVLAIGQVADDTFAVVYVVAVFLGVVAFMAVIK